MPICAPTLKCLFPLLLLSSHLDIPCKAKKIGTRGEETFQTGLWVPARKCLQLYDDERLDRMVAIAMDITGLNLRDKNSQDFHQTVTLQSFPKATRVAITIGNYSVPGHQCTRYFIYILLQTQQSCPAEFSGLILEKGKPRLTDVSIHAGRIMQVLKFMILGSDTLEFFPQLLHLLSE